MGLQQASFKGLPTILIILGFVILLLAIALGLGGFSKLLKVGIGSQTKIIAGSDAYKMWEDVPLAVYLTIRFFNITNPEEFHQGEKPKLQECGPYVYREHLYKKEINMFPENDTSRYHQYHDYFFEPGLSGGSESDLITMVNIPLVAMAKMAHDFTDVDYILSTLDEMLSKKGEKFIRRETVRDILWDGFSVQSFIELANDPMIKNSGQEVNLPPAMADGRMGLFEGRNESHDGWFEVLTGLNSPADFGRFIAHNYQPATSVWNASSCNAMNGTDGMLFPPFNEDVPILQFFTPQMCRTLSFEFTKEVVHHGIKTRRYQTAKRMFQSPKTNPDNWCFCPHADLDQCDFNGFLNIGPCVQGAPMYISNPHLLFVDKNLQELVEGLSPDPEKHWGFMDLHPLTSVAIEAKHRFQFNIRIQRWEAMETFENVPNTYLPIFWLQEGADLAGQTLDVHKLLSAILGGWDVAKFGLGAFGGLVLPGLACLLALKKSKAGGEVTLLSTSTGSEKALTFEAFQ